MCGRHRRVRLPGAFTGLWLVLVHRDVRARRQVHDDVPRVPVVAQDVPRILPAALHRHVLDGKHRLRLLGARRLRLVLAHQVVRTVPGVLDDVRGVRLDVQQPPALPGQVLPAVSRAAQVAQLRCGRRLHLPALASGHQLRDRNLLRETVLASAAGIGGGAVLVPLFTMIGEFTEHEAIPLSIAPPSSAPPPFRRWATLCGRSTQQRRTAP